MNCPPNLALVRQLVRHNLNLAFSPWETDPKFLPLTVTRSDSASGQASPIDAACGNLKA